MLTTPMVSQQELDSLRRRLTEAEDLLRAIRTGEVDAIVVDGPVNPAVYTLKGAADPYRLLVEQMSEGALTVSSAGVIMYCNLAFADMIGQPRERVMGQLLTELFVRQSDKTQLAEFLARTAHDGEETQLKAADGTIIFAYVSSTLLRVDNEPVHCLVATDLSRQALRIHHEAIVSSSPDAIYSLQPDGTIESWNAAAASLYGYATSEAIGKNVSMLVPAMHWQEFSKHFESALRGQTAHRDVPCRKKGGEIFEASFGMSPIKGVSGGVGAIAVIVRDITERKLSEEALRLSEARLSMTQAVAGIGAWELNLETNESKFNETYYQLCGLPYGTPHGYADFLRLVHPDDRSQVGAATQAMLAGKERSFEYRLVRASDGATRWFADKGRGLCDGQGVIRRLVGAVIDVTERREAEEHLRHADRRKDEFIATLAHELRNPLAPISSGLYVLRDACKHDPGTERIRCIMERQVSHLVRLVDDLLDISRITHGKIQLRKERINLIDLLHQVCETITERLVAKGVRLTVALPDEPLFLDADPVRINQVFANILDNAGKYNVKGGEVAIRAECRGDQVVVIVSDTGLGIPRDMLPRVFDLFLQIDRDHGSPRGGLGIGLALARNLVQMHDGKIEVQSKGEGKGSQFLVTLPARGAGPNTKDVTEEGKAQEILPKARRILVVDDNQDAADCLAVLLESLGGEVCVAYSGSDGVEVAATFGPEIVFLDLGMPGLDGYETASHIRKQPGGRDVRMVALTGWSEKEIYGRVKDAGFDDHLTKPAALAAIIEVMEWHRKSVSASPTNVAATSAG